MNVYDFDDTIYNGESTLDLFFFYIRRYPFIIKYFPRVMSVLVRYKAGKMPVEEAEREYVPLLKECIGEMPGYDLLVEKFWDEHMRKIRPFYRQLQRPDDVIITASPDLSIAVICRRLGIRNYISSTLDAKTGEVTRLCMRERKRDAFLAEYPDATVDNVYTDSPENDKWLVDMGRHAYLVRGKKITQIK